MTFPIACGDDDDDAPNNPPVGGAASGGAGATDAGGASDGGTPGATPLPPGLSSEPSTKECGGDTCNSVSVLGAVHVNPCCGADEACGLDSGFLGLVGAKFEEQCQVKAQPGDVDEACPSAEGLKVPFQGAMIALDTFAGCCRPNGTCGVVINEVTSGKGKVMVGTFGLGCVDGAPFFKNEVTTCGAGGGGNGGAGGMGAGGESTVTGGAGGAAGSAGAGGAL